MLLGTLDSIWRYPVKSLRGERLDSVEVGTSGIPGDRQSALFVRDGHAARAGKTLRGKEHDRLHLVSGADSGIALAAQRGIQAECRREEHFFDDAPISIVLDRWLDELSSAIGYAVEPERFRPNFFVRAAAAFTAGEATLEGARLDLGGVCLRVRGPIERCVTTTYDPNGGPSDPRVLRLVAQRRNTWMGVYCDVVTPGHTRAGDSLVLVSPA
jgi:MOSC domain-containing protein